MGEVYRADDLTLGQSVALKFLPQGLENDPERLQRFLGEVRVALKVTHPNVCRVYDIGEFEGTHYLSMEYVDGEDLSILLRRIGRLPEDKAVQIARQLCAGLAAAHEQGILHRDLKPANVMIDGRGDVRITDFGLAGLADGFTGVEIRAGTPAFMAPEQIAGREVTIRSDIYALGLVLYELFTGKRAFTAESQAELSQLQSSGPTSPTSHVALLDPLVESVILRCLAEDPADRPTSVVKVAVALPGADPLAAALAAGETPSPEMVADAGDDSALERRIAVPVMILTVLSLLAATWIIGRYQLLGRVPMELSPQVLAHRAQEVARDLGYGDPPADRAWGFWVDTSTLLHVDKDSSIHRWDRLATDRPNPMSFWYRQSPRSLIPRNLESRVYFNDPPVRTSGMVNLTLDSVGNLKFLKAVPPQQDVTALEDGPEPNWEGAFEAAGLEISRFNATQPQWLPEAFCNQRAAWLGTYPKSATSNRDPVAIRIESCAYRGSLVYFSMIHPWSSPSRQSPPQRTTTQEVQNIIGGFVFLSFLLGATLLARRNLKLGRGDRRGALRLGTCVGAMTIGTWLFQASHVSDLSRELNLFTTTMGAALFDAGIIWLLYIALEPFVRRRWPESLVSWNRLLSGRLRDPLVGRHLLYGAALGVGVGLLDILAGVAPTFFGKAAASPSVPDLDTLLGSRWVLGEVFSAVHTSITNPLIFLFFLVLLRVTLRNSWLALVAFVVVMTFLYLPEAEVLIVAAGLIKWSLIGFFMMRFGLVALIAAAFFSIEMLQNQPLTLDFSTWYAGSSLLALGAAVAVVLWAFRTSLGDRPLFAEEEV